MSANSYKTAKKPIASAISEATLKREIAVHGVVAYPTVTEPDPETGKYSTLLIIPRNEPTLETLLELIGDHAEALTGSRTLGAKYHNPIRDADERKPNGELVFKHAGFRGDNVVVRLKSGFAPKCFYGANKTPCDPGEIKGGDECLVGIQAFHFNNQSAGVALSLSAILLIGKTEHVIEKGQGGGTSFDSLDLSGVKFRTADATFGAEA